MAGDLGPAQPLRSTPMTFAGHDDKSAESTSFAAQPSLIMRHAPTFRQAGRCMVKKLSICQRRGVPMQRDAIFDLMNDPVAQELVKAAIHARLAYSARDGSPRVIPIGYSWNGEVFVMGSAANAPKVKALAADPKVALTVDTDSFPPHVLLVRGVAGVEVVDGVPDEFVEASRRFVGEKGMPEWEAGVRALYKQMAIIRVTPTWAKISDFETRMPSPVEELIKGNAG
jgi:hypothetical protein